MGHIIDSCITHKQEYREFEKLDAEAKAEQNTTNTTQDKLQMTLKQTIKWSQAYSFDHPRARELHRTISEMICVDCVPMYTVEKPGFRCLHNILEP